MRVDNLPLAQIRRPLIRQTDPQKVEALIESIAAIGQQEPIDILEVEGQYYGFSGCHRYDSLSNSPSPPIGVAGAPGLNSPRVEAPIGR
jgi:sulfiredoxin